MPFILGLGLSLAHRRKPKPPQPFDPIALLGEDLLAYWDAENADSITQSDGLVSAWEDLVAGKSLSQANGDMRPTYSADGFGGRPCLVADGIDDCLTYEPNPFTPPYDVYVACGQIAVAALDTSVRSIWGAGGSQAQSARLLRTTTGGQNNASSIVSNNTYTVPGTDFTGRHVLRFQISTAGHSLSVNTATLPEETAATPANITGTRIRIFAGTADVITQFWHGTASAVLVTNALGPEVAQQVVNGLMRRT